MPERNETPEAPTEPSRLPMTRAEALVCVHVAMMTAARKYLEGWKTLLHASPDPTDRRDAHLVLEVGKGAIGALEAASVALMASQQRVQAVPGLIVPGGREA
jgi:hypothetical protein